MTANRTSNTGKYNSALFLFLFIFVIKFLVLFYFARLSKCQVPDKGGYFSFFSGDSFSYIGAMEHYVSGGTYFFNHGGKEIHAGRMPYYGSVYYLLRLVCSPAVSYDLLVLLQIAIESLSIICLAFISKKLFRSQSAFIITVSIAFLSLNTSYWSLYLLPESLSISVLVFFIYHYLKYKWNWRAKNLFLSSLFFSFLVLLKPYFLPLAAFIFADLFSDNFTFTKLNAGRAVKHTLLTCCLLSIFLLPWIIRNYKVLHRFIPMQESSTAGYNYTEADFACRRFIQAWGGTASVYWDKRSAACYFKLNPRTKCEFVFPQYALSNGYTMNDVENIRADYFRLQSKYSDSLNLYITLKFDQLTSIFKSEHPFRYYVTSPLIIARSFLFHSGSYYLPVNASFKCFKKYQLVAKGMQSIIYYFVLFTGFAGLVALFFHKKNTGVLVIVPVYLVVFFCFYLRIDEDRFFNASHPVLILGATYVVLLILNTFKKNNLTDK